MPAAGATIDRLSTTPYYQQLCDVLDDRIRSKTLAVGARLPSEHDLCAEFSLSRATVRQALLALEQRGSVERVPGRGVFVRDAEDAQGWVIQSAEGFLENAIGHQNRAVTTEVLRAGPLSLSGPVARLLGMADGETGFELVRLRSLDGVPALFSINYSPPALVPVIADADAVLGGRASFSALLTQAGYAVDDAKRTIVAEQPPKAVADALRIRRTAPLLHIRSVSWRRGGTCFDVYDTWVRSDIVPLEVSVSALASGAR